MRNRIKKAFIAVLAVSILSTSAGIAVLAEEVTTDNTAVTENITNDEILTDETTTDETTIDGIATDETITDETITDETITDEAITDDRTADEELSDKKITDEAELQHELENANSNEDELVLTFSMDAANFDDISAEDWFHSYVSWVFSKNIMTGKGENKFAPSETLSRAQFATVLYRMAGSPAVEYNAKFPDVPADTFYSNAVSWAIQTDLSVITGYENGMFGPADSITREQMATMLSRYYTYKKFEGVVPVELDGFPDMSTVSEYASDAMKWAVGAKIISGDQGNLNPLGETSRAVCATMITRFCEEFMPGELPDIDMSATCGKIEVVPENVNLGTFRVNIHDVQATTGISKVQAYVQCSNYEDGGHWYSAEIKEDGTYAFVGDPANHRYHSGTYNIDVHVLLQNGVRLYTGTQTTEVNVAEIQARIYNLRENIYNQVGRDLYQCYLWSVMPYYDQGNGVPAAYTQSQWYSIYGMENHRGDCQVMAATFYQLALGLGYEARYVQGYVPLASGGMGEHGWVEINMGGTTYVFDPDFQSETGRNGYQITYGMSGTWRYSNYGYVD